MANEILPFGLGAESNVMTQAEYEALAARSGGFSSGVAKSEQLNKVWRQSAFVASVLAQFIANRSEQDVLDDGDTANLLTSLELAIKTYANASLPAASTSIAGIAQLSNSTTSTSETLAATPKAVKTVNDAALKIANNLSEIATAGPAAVATTLANLGLGDVAHLPQLTGVVGTSRNAKMSVTTTSATATFTADELIVQTELGGLQYKLTNFNKSVNLATTGAGGMDIGTVPSTGYVALYAIYNPTTQVSALLAVNATSVLAPEVYGGSNMPSGYTASALASVWKTNASRLLSTGFQKERNINTNASILIQTTTQQSVPVSLSISNFAPINAVKIKGVIKISSSNTTNGQSSVVVAGMAINGISFGQQNLSSGSGFTAESVYSIDIISPQYIYYSATCSSGSLSFTLYLSAC